MLPLTALLTGVVFVIVGFFMSKFPPKKINRLIGYRTARSMKNQQQWDFAQTYSAKEMMKLGALLVLCSVPLFFIKVNEPIAGLITFSLIITTISILLFRVERGIRIRFPDHLSD